MTYDYKLWLNQGRFEPMELAHTGKVDALDSTAALEALFYTFNMEHPADYQNRSLSVGDVVVLDGAPYLCLFAGRHDMALWARKAGAPC